MDMLSNIIDNSSVSTYSIEYLQGLADRFEVDEIYILNDQGEIISGTRKEYIGLNLDSGEQMSYFKPMLTDKNKQQIQNRRQIILCYLSVQSRLQYFCLFIQ